MLPLAVRISITLRHETPKSLLNLLDSEKPPPVVYSLLVNLPNAKVDTSQANQQATPPTSTPYQADPSDKASSGRVAKVAKVVKPAKAAVSAVRRAVRRVAVSVAVASAAGQARTRR